jgi:hypothetical protein
MFVVIICGWKCCGERITSEAYMQNLEASCRGMHSFSAGNENITVINHSYLPLGHVKMPSL